MFSNVNIPWPGKGMGDAEYLHAFQRIVMPIARSFDPELVISAFIPCDKCDQLNNPTQSLLALMQLVAISSVVATSLQKGTHT
jgi:hypothetical protein